MTVDELKEAAVAAYREKLNALIALEKRRTEAQHDCYVADMIFTVAHSKVLNAEAEVLKAWHREQKAP